eukprot:Sspe_Gene.119080::Locus_114038_Transcript_1_1_Confidence_1.000_Length_473::g.119080::m.119080
MDQGCSPVGDHAVPLPRSPPPSEEVTTDTCGSSLCNAVDTPSNGPEENPANASMSGTDEVESIDLEQGGLGKKAKHRTQHVSHLLQVVRSRRIPYESTFYVLFAVTTALFVTDRFTTNVWPRDSFQGSLPGLKDSFGHDV